ncbi:unnamed protein product [Prunus brigantina]
MTKKIKKTYLSQTVPSTYPAWQFQLNLSSLRCLQSAKKRLTRFSLHFHFSDFRFHSPFSMADMQEVLERQERETRERRRRRAASKRAQRELDDQLGIAVALLVEENQSRRRSQEGRGPNVNRRRHSRGIVCGGVPSSGRSSPRERKRKSPASMKAVVITTPGGPEFLQLQEVEDPELKDNEVLIKVEATSLNRADILQRKGMYPPPPGSSPYLGLECSGTIEAVGKQVSRWQVGDKVCALLSGGGYAEKVAVPAGQVLLAPPGVSLQDAASFPEVSCTVWSTVFMMSRLSAGETFLVHGGSSGIGTFAIQIAKYWGAKVFVTAGSKEKLAFCKNLGADVCINYKTEDFVARVKEETGGKGVNVILDIVGAEYFRRNLDSLSFDGRLFVIGMMMGGAVTEIDLRVVLSKRLTIQAAGLRYRSPENKAAIVREVENNVWPAIVAGKVKPVVYKYFPLSEAAEAHLVMEKPPVSEKAFSLFASAASTQFQIHENKDEVKSSRSNRSDVRDSNNNPHSSSLQMMCLNKTHHHSIKRPLNNPKKVHGNRIVCGGVPSSGRSSPRERKRKSPASMKAVVITTPGGPEVLQLQEVEDPELKDNEVLIKVEATALNRADILQRKGMYPPPPGSSPYLGLECSGTIEAVGKQVSRFQVGDKVCALLSGGGYAEKVAVPAGQVLLAPPGVSLKYAASFPEVSCTVWSTVFMMSRLSAGETFLVHGGSSGIGTFAIQMAKYWGAKVFVTAGSKEKLAFCKNLGADVCINYKTEDFVARVKEETGGKGVDVILDIIGAEYFRWNLDSLSFDGRLFVIGTMGGAVTEIDLRVVLSKRLTIQAAGLRYRSPENKAAVVREVENNVWPAIVAGKVKPVVYKCFPLSEAAEAHRLMESSKHIGKILLLP